MSTQPVNIEDLEWSFGDRIRKLRRVLGLSQKEFAEAIGAGPRAIGAWELGTNSPEDVVLIAKRIERQYGVRAAWVLGLENTPRPSGPRGGNGGVARPEGFEPPTFWLGVEELAQVIPFPHHRDPNPEVELEDQATG